MASVFLSYAHEDEGLRDQLEKHLSPLKREGVIETWHDRRIGPGDAFADEIDAALETSDIVLLLVSADFLASDYCHDIEMRRALERHQQGLTRVIPVILRPCDWQSAALGYLNAVPKDGNPMTQHQSLDEGFVDVALAIRRAAQRPTSPVGVGTTSKPVSPATSELRPSRSSNLRIPRTFTDRDRDHFFDEGVQYIADFLLIEPLRIT
ncbi:MAG: toll/interleukin-1 receptor domain-containing protein [Thiocapsa sp.]|uniref:toll/interleukin-1 receptor domain-containing protein n=1 Tax=Thiocapsa sp. TaxID=2024551 RepID=UPI001BCCCB4D|nr:toll/interleukin-1 receptor domain-containing protein [Thiocapsa sp.]QVL48677.1 MAG: toll/interleukin-1 receptor domain-containing protein [Thiocapsa sp.]